MITQAQIDKVIERLIDNVKPEKIILYGSYAEGTPTEDSDLDLLIVKGMQMPRYKRSKEVKKHLRGLAIPVDIIVYTQEEVYEWEGVKNSFVNQVFKNGKVVYEQ